MIDNNNQTDFIRIMEHTLIKDKINKDGLVIVDLGACKGEFISPLGEYCNIDKAILVEACPKNFNVLKNNFGNDSKYKIYNNVISSKENLVLEFYEDINSDYNGSTCFKYSSSKKHDIKSITLEELVKENNLTNIDVLKIDIEGAEYEVLNYFIEKKLYNITDQITVEFHDFIDERLKEQTENIIREMKNVGFKHYSVSTDYMLGSSNYDVLFYKN
jgi:FkbM family methyltransferase